MQIGLGLGINRVQGGGLPTIGGQAPLRAWEFDTGRTAGMTFTRASQATVQNADGTWTTLASDVMRIEDSRLVMEGAQTNVLLNSATLSTQSVTVTAQVYTLSMQGTGSITLSGAATGTLTGTGAANRVRFIFTPSAGTLTLTVSGSVTYATLVAGGALNQMLTSWIPTGATAATRAADKLSLDISGLSLSSGFWVVTRGMRFEAFAGSSGWGWQFDSGATVDNRLAFLSINDGTRFVGQYNGNVEQAVGVQVQPVTKIVNTGTRFTTNNFAQVWGDGTTNVDTVAAYTAPTILQIATDGRDIIRPARLTLRGIYLYPASITLAQMQTAIMDIEYGTALWDDDMFWDDGNIL